MIYFLRNLNQKKNQKPNTQIKQNKDLQLQRKKYVVARWEGIGEMNEINEGN